MVRDVCVNSLLHSWNQSLDGDFLTLLSKLAVESSPEVKYITRTHNTDTTQTQYRQNIDTIQTQYRHNTDTIHTQHRHNTHTTQTQHRHNTHMHSLVYRSDLRRDSELSGTYICIQCIYRIAGIFGGVIFS